MQPPETLPPPEVLARPRVIAPEIEPGVTARLQRDRALQLLLVLTLLVNLALLAFLALRFDALPDPLPLHFDAMGQPDRIDVKSGIFALPLIGLIVLMLNT